VPSSHPSLGVCAFFLSFSSELKVSHSTLAQQGRGLARTGTHTGTPPEPPKRKRFFPSGLSHSTLYERGGVRTVPLCSCVAHLSWRCLLYLLARFTRQTRRGRRLPQKPSAPPQQHQQLYQRKRILPHRRRPLEQKAVDSTIHQHDSCYSVQARRGRRLPQKRGRRRGSGADARRARRGKEQDFADRDQQEVGRMYEEEI